MAGRRFDTCFFERYAQLTLERLLGDDYSDLINEDRPDLQKTDKSLGIEVTRAMEESKDAASSLLMEMAGVEAEDCDKEEIGRIISSGYGYGLQDGRYIGQLEYEYWRLALPLRRIIASKIEKVGAGFYGEFDEFGLYIFCRDDLTHEEVVLTMEYASDLQRHLDLKYSKIYLSLIDKLHVCDLTNVDRLLRPTTFTSYAIPKALRWELFTNAL